MSAVITRSPAATRSTISWSAASKPWGTARVRTLCRGGTAGGRLATSTSSMPVRPAARSRISRIATGQASASTQMVMGHPRIKIG
jgi:hypothetical protein